jgi:cytochrome b involved in lipid metabolism
MKNIFILTILIFLIASCSLQQDTNKSGQYGIMDPSTKSEQPNTTLYSFTELSQHNSEDDCWLLISGRVYEVTEFIASHPGKKAILQGCGQEASALFSTRPMGSGTDHSDKAKSTLKNYYIGNLKSNTQ